MIKIKIKDKNDKYDVTLKGKSADVWELICALDVVIGQLKKHYKLSYREITEMLFLYKHETKGGE